MNQRKETDKGLYLERKVEECGERRQRLGIVNKILWLPRAIRSAWYELRLYMYETSS